MEDKYITFLNDFQYSGSYSVSFSFYTADDAEDGANDVYLYKNDNKMMETLSPSETAVDANNEKRGKVFQTSGRSLYLQLQVNDSLHLGCRPCHEIFRVNFCVALVKSS